MSTKPQDLVTPLNGAIWKGMISIATVYPQGGRAVADAVERDVLDFLRQKFATAYVLMSEVGDPVSMTILRELAIQLGVEKPKPGTEPILKS